MTLTKSNGQAIRLRSDNSRVLDFADRYEIFEEASTSIRLAHSAMFPGYDAEQQVKVTIERLQPDSDEVTRGLFSRKARFLRKLTHQNLVKVNDFNEAAGLLVLDELSGALSEEKIRASDALKILEAGLLGLRAIHGHKKLHGNLSAACIVRGSDSAIKIGDTPGFEADDPDLLNPRPCLAAPEMVDPDNGEVGPASDLFCLGLAVLEVVLGKRVQKVYCGDQRRWAVSRQPFPIALIKKLPEEAQSVFQKLVSKDPKQRFASAAEALERISGGETDSPETSNHLKSSITFTTSPFGRRAAKSAEATLLDKLVDIEWLTAQAKKPAFIASLSAVILFAALTAFLLPSDRETKVGSAVLKISVKPASASPRLLLSGNEKHVEWKRDASGQQGSFELSDGQHLIFVDAAGFEDVVGQNVLVKQGKAYRWNGENEGEEITLMEFILERQKSSLKITAQSELPARRGSAKIELFRVSHPSDPIITAFRELDFKGESGRYLIRASMQGHEDHEQVIDLQDDKPHDDIPIKLVPWVELIVRCEPSSAPDHLIISTSDQDQAEVQGIPNADFTEYRTKVPPNSEILLFANKLGFEPLSTSLTISGDPRMVESISMEKLESPEPEGNEYEISTVHRQSDSPLSGLEMLVDGQPVTGNSGRKTTPFAVRLKPGYHQVQFIDPKSDETVFRHESVRFLDRGSTESTPMEFLIRQNRTTTSTNPS